MIQPIGYLKLHRELFNKPIWLQSTPEQKTVLVTLLAMASFKPNEWEWKGERFKTVEGQFITSLDSIVLNCGKGVSIQNVRTALKRFEKYGFLTNESTKQGRLITIDNWCLYQSSVANLTNDLTVNQQTTNKELTDDQQTTNKRLTPIEEGNKENKDNKEKRKVKTKAQIFAEELEQLYQEFNIFPPITNAIEEFIEHRRLLKKPMSILAVKKFINKLQGETNNPKIQIELLDDAIANGWQTIYPKKTNKNQATDSFEDYR